MSKAQTLRQCLSRFVTGVTVITGTDAAGRRCGMTAAVLARGYVGMANDNQRG